MQLTDIFLKLGRDNFDQLLRSVSIGRLKTFQLFERLKARLHVQKLNAETLRKAGPRVWSRLESGEQDFAEDLAQAILVSHMDMIRAVLDHLEIPHQDGFFSKDADLTARFQDGWQQAAWNKFRGAYAPAALLFYLNHLGWEVAKTSEVFAPTED